MGEKAFVHPSYSAFQGLLCTFVGKKVTFSY